jgi:hypothetical protein
MTESNALRRSIKQAYTFLDLFKINGLIDDFDHSCSPVLLGQKHISCLLYADDLVLLSESQEGLQNRNKTWGYCKSWGLEINYTKSKLRLSP